MAAKSDKTKVIVCAVGGSLGLLSAILGFSAEGSKLTADQIGPRANGDCYYPPNAAFGLGISATIFLVMAQITVAVAGGCCGCCTSTSKTYRTCGIVCAVFSWLLALVAWRMYIVGAALNVGGVREYCDVLKDGAFASGAVLALIATALGIGSYVLLRQPRDEQQQPGAAIAIGLPQIPPPRAKAPPNGHLPPATPFAAKSYGHEQV